MRPRSAFLAPLLASALALGCETRPELDLSSTVLDYGVLDNSLTVRIKNTGKQQLHWSAVSETEWIDEIVPALGTLDEDSEESILVTINREGLTVGPHSGSLRIIANGEHPEEIIEVLCMIETEEELVFAPGIPSGPASLCAGAQGSYAVSASLSSWGHALEYQFEWEDGQLSSWEGPQGTRAFVEGSYCVKVRARCSLDTTVVSDWSACAEVEVADESIVAPAIPSGPTNGATDQVLAYVASGAASTCGHPVAVQFDWGDGTQSTWGSGSDSHAFGKGFYCIKTRARCEIHPSLMSAWTECLNVSIATGESVSAPSAPAGSSSLCIGVTETYTTGGAASSMGHAVEYQFDWDGSVSSWGATSLPHAFGEGTYCVRARARCTAHTDVISAWSICNTVVVAEEEILPPSIPSGPATGSSGQSLTYSTGGGASTCGHPLQYQFDWGDDNLSSWGAGTRSHSWSTGPYCVRARARCQTHTGFVSDWSACFDITIGPAEVVSPPSEPSGPGTLCIGVPGNYTTGNAASNLDHTIEYQFDWGDGTQSPWGVPAGSHDWDEDACVKARARCAEHTSVVSNWSVCHNVDVAAETVAAPAIPIGPTAGSEDDTLSYTTAGGASSCGHDVEYQFDWGDGSASPWGPATRTHSWEESEEGYCVKARSRCTAHTTVVSAYSACLNIVIGSGETISAPTAPAGSSTLCIGVGGNYTTGGSTSSMGHAVEYQYDWGDGDVSPWGGTARSHSWEEGSYCVKARARCVTHNGVISAWSICHDVDVGPETIVTPTIPSGPAGGFADETLSYTTGGASSSCGHSLHYRFDWGDGDVSEWGSPTRSHSWDEGEYCIKAQARCATHQSIQSDWSACFDVDIGPGESVNAPNAPTGPSSLCIGVTGNYSTSGATSSMGHTVEYQFDWNDGTQSSWGASFASHSWSSAGDRCVKARARCTTHTSIVSAWSVCKDVDVDSETVFSPTTPTGPNSGDPGDLLAFATGGASSSCSHPIEYQFDWGDGDVSGWGGSTGQHTFSAGSFCVRARARCLVDTQIQSAWSGCLTVNIDTPENVTIPDVPSGPSFLCLGASGDYTTGDATSSLDHVVEYQFEWDDGTLSQWGTTATRSHSWGTSSDYCVRARARCATHTSVESDWSDCRDVTVEAETVSAPSPPSGPSEGEPDEVLSYSASGASSTCGHGLQVQFDWGDGTQSSWGSGTDSHSWPEGAYCVQARARCSTHTSIESGWSGCTSVTIAPIVPQESVSSPNAPAGPTSLCEGESGDYSTDGAASNLGHTLEYQYDWGDGSQSSWGPATASHSFGPGTPCVQVRARCATHTGIESPWSTCTTVTVDAHVVSAPTVTGPTEGQIEVTYCYEATGAVCSCGDAIDHYEFDWGPGQSSSPCHSWEIAGTYCVRARAVCTGDHASGWSECLTVNINRSVFLELKCVPGCENLSFVSNFYESISLVMTCSGTACESPVWGDCSGCGIRIHGRLLSDCDFYPSSSGTTGIEISPAATSIEFTYRAAAQEDLLGLEEVEMQICLDDDCVEQPISGTCERYSPSFVLTQSAPPRKVRVGMRGGLNDLDLLVGESTNGAAIRYEFPGWFVPDHGSFSGTVNPLLASGPAGD